MKRTIKRRLSILLALVMLFSLLPTLSAPVSAEPATYTLVGATATSTGVTSYTVPEGKRYTTNIGSSLTPVFSDDNTPPSGDVKTSTFPLCTDESCNNNLSEDPTVGVTYYSYFHIYNSDACPDDVTIDYTHVDLSKVSISIAGYSVNVLSSTAKYVNSKPGVEIKYSVTRQAAPATYAITFDPAGSGTAHDYTGNIVGEEISSAAEGAPVYLVSKASAAPEGKYCYGWTSDDVTITGGNAFTMPAKAVTVKPNYKDRVEKTYDVSGGVCDHLEDSSTDSMSILVKEDLVKSDTAYEAMDPNNTPVKLDLDKNDSWDLSFGYVSDSGWTYTVLGTNSVTENKSFTITEQGYWIKSVTFLFKAPVTEYPVWVGDTQVTSANKDNILGDTGTPTAVYDPDSKTLTLANPTVSGSHEDSIIYSEDDLTVKGTATLNDPMNAYGIYSLKTVTISGSDTNIKVSSSGFGIYSKNGDVVINSGSVDAAGTGSNCAGIFADYNITISGGTVKATGSLAVDADKISVKAGTLTAEGTTHGLRADDLTISGGTVTVTGGSCGVEAGHSVTVNGGTAEFTGNTNRAFDFDNITIADGLSVLVNHDANASGATPWNGTDHLGGNYGNDFKYVKIGSGILPTTYPVWVGGVQLTSENIDGAAIPGVKYDPSTFTLTLTDADITGADGVVGIRSEGIDLVIEGKGNVKASGAVGIAVSKKDGSGGSLTIDADLYVSGIFGMNVENTLTIKGGELTISLSASASTAITAGAVDVQGGTVWANSSGSYAFNVSGDFKISAGDVTAQYDNYGIYAGGNVKISGGTLTVDSALYGISARGNMEITGGMVTAKSNGSTGKGIMAENGDITISGASTKVIAEGTKKGIMAENGDITISGGTVTAKGGEEGIEAGTDTITISGGTVVAEATGSSGIGIQAKVKITVSGDGTAVTGKALSGSCGVRTDGAIEVNGGSLEGKCAETGYGIYADGGISFAATHEIVIPEGGTLSESSKTIFASGGGGVAAHAKIAPKEPAYPLWVGGLQIKDSNKDAISTVTGGSAKYDPASNTLTLTGVTGFTGMYYASSPNQYYGIFYNPDSASECLNIVLEGENKFTDFVGNNTLINIEEGSAVISGSGTLTVSTGKPDMVVWCAGNLTVSAALDLVAVRCCLLSNDTLTISADVTARSDDMSSAISADKVVINGGRVEAINKDGGAYSWAIEASHGITIAATHAIVLPEGGKVENTYGGYYIVDSSHNKVKHVIIEPIDVAYPVWVGGMQVKDSNKTDILGDGTAKFDPATNTLTLDGLNVGDGLHASGASIVSTGIDLTVTGSATLTGSGYGIFVINLSGGGSLTLDKAEITYAGDSASDVGVKADGDITIKDSKLELSAKNNGVCAGGAISIDGGTVKAEATDTNNGTAIEAAGDISISNADVTATAGNGPFTTGVYSETGDITISGGTVTATAGGGGVYAFGGEVKIENGTEKVEATVGTVAVRGKTGVTIGDELMIKLPEGGEVKSKSGFYEIMDGTDTARHALIVPKEATVYTVTFDANSGSGTMTPNPVTVVAGKKLTLPACTFTPPSADKEFDKWDAGKPGDEVEITSDCVIRAIWKEKTAPVTYTVTVTDDGNGTATASPASGASGDEVTLTATPKSGYKFKEWKVVSGGVTVTDNKFKIGTANVEIQAIFEKEAAPVPAVYTVVGGGDSEWTKGSGKTLTVTVKRDPNDSECFSHFASVELGGKTLTAGTDYDAKSGSTIVTIKAAALEKLAAGKHTISILFDDGKAETKVTIKAGAAAGAKDSSPKTGQERTMIIWVPLMLVSGLGLCAVLITDKKRRPAGRH